MGGKEVDFCFFDAFEREGLMGMRSGRNGNSDLFIFDIHLVGLFFDGKIKNNFVHLEKCSTFAPAFERIKKVFAQVVELVDTLL